MKRQCLEMSTVLRQNAKKIRVADFQGHGVVSKMLVTCMLHPYGLDQQHEKIRHAVTYQDGMGDGIRVFPEK